MIQNKKFTDNPDDVLRQMRLIFSVLTLVLLLLTGILYFILVKKWTMYFEELKSVRFLIDITASMGGILGGFFLKKVMLQKIHKENTISTKLAKYSQAFFVQVSLLSGVALLNLILGYITHSSFYPFIALALIGYLLTLKPTPQKMADEIRSL